MDMNRIQARVASRTDLMNSMNVGPCCGGRLGWRFGREWIRSVLLVLVCTVFVLDGWAVKTVPVKVWIVDLQWFEAGSSTARIIGEDGMRTLTMTWGNPYYGPTDPVGVSGPQTVNMVPEKTTPYTLTTENVRAAHFSVDFAFPACYHLKLVDKANGAVTILEMPAPPFNKIGIPVPVDNHKGTYDVYLQGVGTVAFSSDCNCTGLPRVELVADGRSTATARVEGPYEQYSWEFEGDSLGCKIEGILGGT